MYNTFLETELDINFYFATTIILGNYAASRPRPNPKPQENNQISGKKKEFPVDVETPKTL
jgi:hypothetical protein